MPPTAAAVSEELSGSILELAGLETTPSVKARLNAVARRLGLPMQRVRKYWYGEIVCPPAHEADLIRAHHQAAKKLIDARAEHDMLVSDFIRNHPNMAFLLPGPLPPGPAPTIAPTLVEHKAAPTQTGKGRKPAA